MSRAVILTALPVEYLAVRSHLTALQKERHPEGKIYERGKFTANGYIWEVGIDEVGTGNVEAAIATKRAIDYFKPDILLFVGIAGGIKDVGIGDVVAATKVYSYESGKVGEQFSIRPALGQSAYALVEQARSEAREGEWLQRVFNSLDSQPRAFVASIAAGEKVVASRQSEFFHFLRTSYNDAIAVDMEGFGFLSAAFAYPNIKAIVIRGISDLIKDKNVKDKEGTEEERQKRASHHASAFAFEVLAKYKVDDRHNILSSFYKKTFKVAQLTIDGSIRLVTSSLETIATLIESNANNRGLLVLLTVALIVSIGGFGYEHRRKQILEIKNLIPSLIDVDSLHSLESLQNGLYAANLTQSPLLKLWRDPGLKTQVALYLTSILNRTHEINRFSTETEIKAIDVNSRNGLIAVGGNDGSIQLWNGNGTSLPQQGKLEGEISSLSFNPDGTKLASGNKNGRVTIWGVNEQGLYSPKSVETHTGYPTKVQLGNKYLVVAVDNGTIELFNSENLQELPPTTTTPAYQRSINSIGLSSNALVSIGDDNGSNGTIKLWEIKENKLSPENFSDSGKTRFTSVDLSKGDREIIAAGNLDGKIQIWELTRDKKDKPLICSRDSHNQKGEIKSVKVFSKDDQTLAISVSKNSKKQILSLWKIQNDTCSFIEEVEEDGNPFESIVFSSDGDLISGGDDKAIRIWDISHFKKSIYEYNEESKLQALEFSSDNSHLASAYSSGKVKLWTVQDDDLKLPLPPCPALDRKISGIGFSQGNKSIIIATDTGNDGVPKRLYELPVSLNSECDKLRKLPNYPENENSIKAIKVSQNAKIIASANADEKIKLWDFNRGTILSTISTDPDLPQSLDISPNHRLLALGSTESKVRLWRIDSTQDKVPELPKLAGHFKGVATISFSPDSETLLSLDGQGTLRLWRISDSKPLAEIQDNQRFLDRIRFNSDKNNPVLAVSIQNRPILWRMELEKLRSQGCDQIRNYLKSNKKDSLCPH